MDESKVIHLDEINGENVEVKLSWATKLLLSHDQKRAIRKALKEVKKNLTIEQQADLPKFNWKKLVIIGGSIFLVLGTVLVFLCKVLGSASSDATEETDSETPFDSNDGDYPSENNDDIEISEF